MTHNRRALLIGINYVDDPRNALRGCVNDVLNTKAFLTSRMGFKESEIRAYVDTDEKTKRWTTAQGILAAFHEIVLESWTQNLDFVWIHYSGHGTYTRDDSSDEADGKDECLCPSDCSRAGMIPDDWVREIFKGFNPNTRVMCVFDCCHSGSIVDLKYRYAPDGKITEEHSDTPIKAMIMSISGCSDHQTSADAFNVQGRRKFTGALTSCMLSLFEQPNGLETLQKQPLTFLESLRGLLRNKGFTQYPQLCTSFKLFSEQPLW